MLEALGSISSTRRRRRRRKDKLWQEARDWEDEDEPREIGQLSSSGKKKSFPYLSWTHEPHLPCHLK
jgi:hypothetical protein